MAKRFCIVALLFALIFSSCSNLAGIESPYYIADKKVLMEEDEDICCYAEAVFEVFNNTEKEIESVELSFFFFDDQNQPGAYNNKIKTSLLCPVMAKHSKIIKVSLDPYIGPEIKESYSVGCAYLSKIVYADGSVWHDQWGVYGIV